MNPTRVPKERRVPAVVIAVMFAFLGIAAAGVIITSGQTGPDAPDASPGAAEMNGEPTPQPIDGAGLPVVFEENLGQWPADVLYGARTASEAVHLVEGGFRMIGDSVSTEFAFAGAPDAVPIGEAELPSVSNYLHGQNEELWVQGAQHYGSIVYPDVYAGIDVRFYFADDNRFEFDYIVAPGADPSAILLQASHDVAVAPDGRLAVHAARTIHLAAPIAYQDEPVAAAFVVDERKVAFELGAYDASRPLIIDPKLGISTFYGGTGTDYVYAIDVDSLGDVYITGTTYYCCSQPTGFPFVNAMDTWLDYYREGFVGKFDGDTGELLWSTYIGGDRYDYLYDIEVGPSGVAVAGYSTSSNFPTSANAYATTLTGTSTSYYDIVVAKLSLTGQSILYGSYIGGGSYDYGYGVAMDAGGDIYVTGRSDYEPAMLYPTSSGAFQPLPYSMTSGGSSGYDVVVSRFDPTAATGADSLLWSTYIGGSETNEYAWDVEVDSAGKVFIGGYAYHYSTTLVPFPNPGGIYHGAPNPGTVTSYYDGFISKLDPAASGAGQLMWTAVVGSTQSDYFYALALDNNGNPHLGGRTYASCCHYWESQVYNALGSSDFSDSQNTETYDYDGVVFGVSGANGQTVVYNGMIRGYNADYIYDLDFDSQGRMIVGGSRYYTSSTLCCGYELMPSLLDNTGSNPGGTDGFIMALDPSMTGSAQLDFSVTVGGSSTDYVWGVAVDPSDDDIFAAGYTYSSATSFPVDVAYSSGGTAWDTTQSGYEGFMVKLGPAPPIAQIDAENLGGTITAQAPTDSFIEVLTFDSIDIDDASLDGDYPIVSWAWDVNCDGTTESTAQTPSSLNSFVGNDDTTISVCLEVTDSTPASANGPFTDDVQMDLVWLNQAPVANFTVSAPPLYNTVPITFDATAAVGGSSDVDGIITTYDWDFGGAGLPDLTTPGVPTFAYDDPGTYTVNLTVTDDDGATNMTSQNVTVELLPNTPPTAGDSSISTPEGTPIAFTVIAFDGEGDPLDYYMISDTTSGLLTGVLPNLVYTPYDEFNGVDQLTFYVDDGEYSSNIGTVTITVTAVNDPPVAFDDWYAVSDTGDTSITGMGVMANDDDIDGPSLTTSLLSPPGVGSVVLNNDGSFVYTAPGGFVGGTSFTYTLSDGTLTDTATVVLAIGNSSPPDAWFEFVVSGLAVTFEDMSTDADGDIVSWAWNFGDGSTSTATNPSISFPDSGTYPVTLTVTDAAGQVSSVTIDVTVLAVGGGAGSAAGAGGGGGVPSSGGAESAYRPQAHAGLDQDTVEGALVTLDGTASFGSGLSYHWQQVAGPVVTLDDPEAATPSFTAPLVDAPGAWIAFGLIVADGSHASQVDYVQIWVEHTHTRPIADAGADLTAFEGEVVDLSGLASYDPDGSEIGYAWLQRTGPTVTIIDRETATPSLLAPTIDTPFVDVVLELIVYDVRGQSVPDLVTIRVENLNDAPVAGFQAVPVDEAGSVLFIDGSTDEGGLSYLWDFGDGEISTARNPTHQYAEEGAYLVELTVRDAAGDAHSISRYIHVQIHESMPLVPSTATPEAGSEPAGSLAGSIGPAWIGVALAVLVVAGVVYAIRRLRN